MLLNAHKWGWLSMAVTTSTLSTQTGTMFYKLSLHLMSKITSTGRVVQQPLSQVWHCREKPISAISSRAWQVKQSLPVLSYAPLKSFFICRERLCVAATCLRLANELTSQARTILGEPLTTGISHLLLEGQTLTLLSEPLQCLSAAVCVR